MNIKITHNWLLDYLETDATPDEIREYLALCGPSIERVDKAGADYVYDIEIISNRIDYASVVGIAQEASAILPLFGKKSKLKFNIREKYSFKNIKSVEPKYTLNVKLDGNNLCSRFAAVVIDNIEIKKSPQFISERLIASGIKSINNVVDVSNYLMLTFGQPVHTFDFDKIGKSTMIMRESKKGEKITTLDEKEITLPGGDIVIEDGNGTIIDLCGIMGGLNSAINDKTKRVLLFVQTYNKEKIRKTTMTTGQRTVAATYFEKGIDEEKVEETLAYGVELLEKYAGGKVTSSITDIYPSPYKEKQVSITYETFDRLIGIKVEHELIKSILKNLDFKITKEDKEEMTVGIPSYRKYDVAIPEDLVEEVARIYGYNKLPNNLPPMAFVKSSNEFEKLFFITAKIKYFLKHLGLNEVINYSMVSKKLLEEFKLLPEDHLRIKNTISEEIEYMRTTLIPSLYKNIKDNTGKKETLKFFEIGKVYPVVKNSLPDETYKIGFAVNTDYLDLKGIVEALVIELNIDQNLEFEIKEKDGGFYTELDLQWFIDNYKLTPLYRPINPFAVIKLDKTFELGKGNTYASIVELAKKSKLLQNIEVVSLFKNKLSLRFYYSSLTKNITETEAKAELEKI